MSAGIDIKVCEKTGCAYSKLMNCELVENYKHKNCGIAGVRNLFSIGCVIPDECLYKSVHMVRNIELECERCRKKWGE